MSGIPRVVLLPVPLRGQCFPTRDSLKSRFALRTLTSRASLRSSTVSALGAAPTRVAEKLPRACHPGSLFLPAQLSRNLGWGRTRRTSPRAFSERCGRSGRSGQEPSGGRGSGGAGRRGAVWAGHGQAQLIQPRGADLPALGSV